MKKFLPALICVFVMLCTGCNSLEDKYLNLYDNLSYETSLDDVLKLYPNSEILTADESAVCLGRCKNTVIQTLVEKCNNDRNALVSAYKYDDSFIIQAAVYSDQITIDDYNNYVKLLTEKYGNPVDISQPKEFTNGYGEYKTQFNITNKVEIFYSTGSPENCLYIRYTFLK